MKKFIAWCQKMKVKVTWKSIAGFCVLVTGIITAASGTGVLPKNVEAAMVVVGGVVLGLERLADAMDNKVAVQAQLERERIAALAPPAA